MFLNLCIVIILKLKVTHMQYINISVFNILWLTFHATFASVGFAKIDRALHQGQQIRHITAFYTKNNERENNEAIS